MDLKYVLKVALKRKYIILFFTFLTVTAAFYFTKNMPLTYTSESIIASGLTDDSQVEIEDKEQKESEIKQQFSNIVELARSKKIIDQVSCKLLAHELSAGKLFTEPSGMFKDLTADARQSALLLLQNRIDSLKDLNYQDKNERGLMDLIKSMGFDFDGISRNLKVKRIDNSDFISVVYESQNPDMSAFVVNELSLTLIKYYKSSDKNKNLKLIGFWAQLTEEKKVELDEKVNTLKDYKIQNQIINLYEQTKSIDNQIAAMEMKREDALKNYRGYSYALENLNGMLSTDERRYAEDILQPYSSRISAKKDEVNSLNEKLALYQFNEPGLVKELENKKAELDILIKQLSDENTFSPVAVKQDIVSKKLGLEVERDIADANVRSIEMEISRLKNKFNSFTPLEGTIQAYERDVDVSSKVYLETLSKLNNQSMKLNVEPRLEQTQAGIPGPAIPNKKGMIIALSGIIALVLSLVVIFLAEYFSSRLNTAKKFASFTKLDIIGMVNSLSRHRFSLNEIFGFNTGNPEIESLKNSLRNVKFEIINKIPRHSIITIASPSKSSGKSMLSAAIAYILSLSGIKVLVIDGSWHNNSLSRQFMYPNGRQQLLSSDSIMKLSSNLEFIGNSGKFEDIDKIDTLSLNSFLNSLKEEYHYIIIDTDSNSFPAYIKPFSGSADFMIGVFRADRSLTDTEKDNISEMKKLTIPYSGSILNFSEEFINSDETGNTGNGFTGKLKNIFSGNKNIINEPAFGSVGYRRSGK